MSKASRKNPFLANRQSAARTANTRLCNGTTATDGKSRNRNRKAKEQMFVQRRGFMGHRICYLVGWFTAHATYRERCGERFSVHFLKSFLHIFCVVIGRPQTCVALSQSQVLDCLGVAIFQTYAAPSCTVMMCEAEYVWFGSRTVIV